MHGLSGIKQRRAGQHHDPFLGKRQRPAASATNTAADGGDDDPPVASSVTPVVPPSSTTTVPPVVSSTTTSREDDPPVVSSTSRTTSVSSSSSVIDDEPVSSIRETSRSSTTLTSATLPTSQTSAVGPSTSVIIRSITASTSSSAAESSSTLSENNSNDSGPGTGAVVGIVAGALVGIVVLASLIGYFFKTKCSSKDDDDFDDTVFNKQDFRRSSAMLPDDDHMSMRSGTASAMGHYSSVGRSVTGANRPRPPSTLERHYQHQSPMVPSFPPINPTAMPSLQPGQVLTYGNAPSEYGGYGQQQYYNQGNLDRAPSVASQYSDMNNNGMNQYYSDLNRQPSNGTSAAYNTELARNGSAASSAQHGYPPYAHYQQNSNLGGIAEGQEEVYARGHSRTGTPEEPNPQYYFKSHVQSPSDGTTRSISQRDLHGASHSVNHRLSIRNTHDAYSGNI